MPELSVRLQRLFAQTKPVCFGRYVMDVPVETELLWGFQEAPSKITVYANEVAALKEHIKNYQAKILATDKTAEITYVGSGPTATSWEIRYFRDDTAKEYKSEAAYTFVTAGQHLFGLLGGKSIATVVKGLRARSPDDIPTDPGLCIDHGFIADNSGSFQEIIGAGLFLPSYPDVSFSVSSNKGASITNGNELTLLQKIAKQKGFLNFDYPKLSTLREGKRQVYIWQGEESLARRQDGSHDFVWESSDRRQNTLYPTLDAKLFSKVAANRVGAAQQASLSDAEMLALWDKLLGSLRFRVDAPPTQTTQKPLLPSTSPASHSGLWQPELPPGHPKTAFVSRTPALRLSQGQRLPTLGLLPGEERDVRWRWIGA
ncbi:T6SS immunity protein Tli4 family protein [Neisseriaceae bacterium TC5R-5]|nr:T6SS immunity protein Tli4 family protein [Neisseriaceae bacterium TC5R-5]